MRVVDRFPAHGFFTGTRTLALQSLPPGAVLKSFRLAFTSIADARGAIGPAEEELSFVSPQNEPLDVARDPTDPGRQTGVTRVTGAGPPAWSEIAFSSLRTLAGVQGTSLAGALLQVDVGGLFVTVDANGTIPAQEQGFALPGNTADLPGLSVRRLRLVAPAATPNTVPQVTGLTLRAVASNLTVAIGDQPAVWAYPGEVADRVETVELAEFAQAALADAPIEGGFAILPVTIKTDTTARLAVEATVEFNATASGLPNALPETTLDYSYDASPDAGADLLAVTVPEGMELDPARTRVEIAGTFEGTEITHGPLIDRAPAAAITLAEGQAAATPVSVDAETVADALDLLLSTQVRAAGVEIDLRADLDGKPAAASLLTRRARASLDVSRFAGPRWLDVSLGQSVTLPPADPATGKPRIWVVVQCLAGPVTWHANPATGTAHMQTSDNGGLSWRTAQVEGIGALDAGLRLRRASPVFRVPLGAEIGRGEESILLSLDEFQPLGRVEFALDSAKFAGAVNDVLASRRTTQCPLGEQLANGDFADRDAGEFYLPADWAVNPGSLGRSTFRVIALNDVVSVTLVRIGDLEGPAQSLSQVIPVSSGCPYRLTFRGFGQSPGTRVELVWRSADCGVIRVDRLEPPAPLLAPDVQDGIAVVGGLILTIPAISLDTPAPEGAQQAEIRVLAEEGARIFVDAISLSSGPVGLVNPELREFQRQAEDASPLRGWSIEPADATAEEGFVARPNLAGLTLVNTNPDGRSLVLSQRIEVRPGAPFTAALEAIVPPGSGAGPPIAFGVVWLDGEGKPSAPPLAASVRADGTQTTRLAGTVPEGVASAEIRIELAPGSGLSIMAVAVESQPAATIPVSFLSEAPGRLTVRDFTVGFRPAPVPPNPSFTAPPCAPTPAGSEPGEVCEPDPCRCGPEAEHQPGAPAFASAQSILLDGLSRSRIQDARAAVLTPGAARLLSSASATARISTTADRLAVAGSLGRTLADNVRVGLDTARTALRPVHEVGGVGDVRTAQLATLGIATVRDLARARPDELVRRLGYNRTLARNLVASAREMIELRPAR